MAVLCVVPSGLVLYIGITSCTFPQKMSKKNDYETKEGVLIKTVIGNAFTLQIFPFHAGN